MLAVGKDEDTYKKVQYYSLPGNGKFSPIDFFDLICRIPEEKNSLDPILSLTTTPNSAT
jgi:hypothetical protein